MQELDEGWRNEIAAELDIFGIDARSATLEAFNNSNIIKIVDALL